MILYIMKISTAIQTTGKYILTIGCVAIGGFIAGKLGIINPSDIICSMCLIAGKMNSFLNSHTMPNWTIILLLVLIYLGIRLYPYIIKRKSLLSYNEDVINNVKWKWSYKHSKNKYSIYNLIPCCTDCGTELSTDRLQSYYCPNCGKRFGHMKKGDDIKKVIEQEIEEKFEKRFTKLI